MDNKFNKIAILLEDENGYAYFANVNKKDMDVIIRLISPFISLHEIEATKLNVKLKKSNNVI